jgi:hypothetical protein
MLCLHQSLLGKGFQRGRFLGFRVYVLTCRPLSHSSSWLQLLAIDSQSPLATTRSRRLTLASDSSARLSQSASARSQQRTRSPTVPLLLRLLIRCCESIFIVWQRPYFLVLLSRLSADCHSMHQQLRHSTCRLSYESLTATFYS